MLTNHYSIGSLFKIPRAIDKLLKPVVYATYLIFAFIISLSSARAQNPVPFVNQPLVPAAATPGGAAFTLTVNGTGFVSGAIVNWNGSARPTTFVNNSQLTAAISSADIAKSGTALVTVFNPTPGGGLSNVVFFQFTDYVPGPIALGGGGSSLAPPGHPTGVIAADFNGDGKLDLAVSNADSSGTVSIFLGDGTGHFQPPVQYLIGGASYSLLAGDFNGDGKLDLAVVNYTSGMVAILLGNGDGTFQPHVDYAANSAPTSLFTADFNGDGKLDLAVANAISGAGTVSVLLGNGDGTFQPPVAYALTGSPFALGGGLAGADFNLDDKLDLVVLTYPGTISILLGNGDGTFQAATDIATGAGYFTVADFNGDGKPDVAFAEAGTTVTVLLGNGDGTFQAGITSTSTTSPGVIIAGDFNGDGKLDLATLGSFVGDTYPGLAVLFGNGDGTFQAEPPIVLGEPVQAMATADFNGDGLLDFAVAVSNAYVSAKVYLQAPRVVSFSPNFESFGSLNTGTTSVPKTVTLTNHRPISLTISSFAVTGSNAGDFAATNNNCPISPAQLALETSCTFNVTFSPTSLDAEYAHVTVTDDATGSPQLISVDGTGVDKRVGLSSTAVNFGSVVVNVTSSTQTVTMTNNGSQSINIMNIDLTGLEPQDFAETNNCPATLAPSGTCTLNITFTPRRGGGRAALIYIFDDSPGNPQSISLTGTGIASAITLSTTSLIFATQPVGTTSASQAVKFTNDGPATVGFFHITASTADFGVTYDCPFFPGKLGVGASCTIYVTFTPKANGPRSGELDIDDQGVGNIQVVSLTGTGSSSSVLISPGGLNFPGQSVGVTSAPQTVTVKNNGTAALTISGIVANSPFAQSNTCPISPATLGAGAGCNISVTFTASFAGTTFGSLIVSDNAPGAPQTVPLAGEASATFGSQSTGTTSAPQAVTVANASTTTSVTVTGVTATGDFAVASNPCGTLPPGGSCAPTVTFTPTALGTRTGSLVVTDNSPGTPHIVPLSGTGVGPTAALSTSSLGFAPQLVGTSSSAQDITVTNSGNQALNINGMGIAPSGEFALVTGTTTCSTTTAVAVGASCAIDITFTPSGGGSRSATLTITDNAPNSPQSVSLTGTGTTVPGVSLSPSTLTFGAQPVGTSSTSLQSSSIATEARHLPLPASWRTATLLKQTDAGLAWHKAQVAPSRPPLHRRPAVAARGQ